MAYQSKRSFALSQIYSQAVIIILAIFNTYYPEYLYYTFIVFLAMAFIISFLTLRSRVRGLSPQQLKEVRESRKVYEGSGDEVMRLMASDMQLLQEIKPLTRISLLSIFVLILTMAWYYVYFNSVRNLSLSSIEYFAVYLVGYEVPSIIMFLMGFSQRKALKNFVQIPRSYTLFEAGLAGQGVLIKFPIENYEVDFSRERRFVELKNIDGKGPTRIRLYTPKPDELAELIRKYGFSKQ
ncbi:MAG: DUF2208 family protein [Thermoproteota archaeon]